MSIDRLQVHLVSPWQKRFECDTAIMSTDIPIDTADALLSVWSPAAALKTFPRRKAWYCCEPSALFNTLERGRWPRVRKRLHGCDFLWHNHEDPRYRVPHLTHLETIELNRRQDRRDRAIAVVSNFGGHPWKRHRDIEYRNQFITRNGVDLYGRNNWKRYRTRGFGRARTPDNYAGEIPGDWPENAKHELMSQYRVAVCLENMNEPGYFTEKFVEAVVAGCVPVYRASGDIAESFLRGASWVDPKDYDNCPDRTLEAALSQDLEHVQEQNSRWLLTNQAFQSTSYTAIFTRIAEILSRD